MHVERSADGRDRARRGCGTEEMERAMALSLRESVHLVSDPRKSGCERGRGLSPDAGRELPARSQRPAEIGAGVGDRGGRIWRPAERGLRLPLRRLGGDEDCAHMTGHGVRRDRRHREGRDRRDLQHAGRSVEGQGARIWPPIAGSRFRRSSPAAITTCTCRRRSSSCTTPTASTTPALR